MRLRGAMAVAGDHGVRVGMGRVESKTAGGGGGLCHEGRSILASGQRASGRGAATRGYTKCWCGKKVETTRGRGTWGSMF